MLVELLEKALTHIGHPVLIILFLVIMSQFYVISILIKLLNKKEDFMEQLGEQIASNGQTTVRAVELMKYLVYGKKKDA